MMKIKELTGKQIKELCKKNKECGTCPLYRDGHLCHLKLLSIYLDDAKYYKQLADLNKDDEMKYEYYKEQFEHAQEKIEKIGEIEIT